LIATPFVAHSVNARSVVPVAIPAALGLIALIAAVINAQRGEFARAFICTILTIVGWVATLFIGLFPRIIVSTLSLGDSVTIQNAQSSHYTLVVMTVAAVVMVPVIILYQWWGFRTLMARLGRGTMPWSAPDSN
jgi:cytochrome d ubiquinol oxidase subunit II